jgi:creatinine amidohydrolase
VDQGFLSLSNPFASVQYELLLPFQLREIVTQRPVAYIPLGTYEWHCQHLPVGLDALTAHGLCLRAALADGGVVLPPLHYGTGGGHGAYPWTMMMPGAAEIEAQLAFTLGKLKSFGFTCAVLFSGHFPPEQLDMIDRLAAAFTTHDFKVIATAVNRIEGLANGPDHAGLFETTLLAAMWPDLVQLDRLPSLNDAPLPDGDADFGEGRHDSSHPIWGVFGPDPRQFKEEHAKPLLDAAVAWLVGQVREKPSLAELSL